MAPIAWVAHINGANEPAAQRAKEHLWLGRGQANSRVPRKGSTYFRPSAKRRRQGSRRAAHGISERTSHASESNLVPDATTWANKMIAGVAPCSPLVQSPPSLCGLDGLIFVLRQGGLTELGKETVQTLKGDGLRAR